VSSNVGGWWEPEEGKTVVLKMKKERCIDALGQDISHSRV